MESWKHSPSFGFQPLWSGQHRALLLCSLLAANSQISVLIGQKMQLTGCDYGNDMRNAICVERNVLT